MVFGLVTAGFILGSSLVSAVTFGVRKARRHHKTKRQAAEDEASPNMPPPGYHVATGGAIMSGGRLNVPAPVTVSHPPNLDGLNERGTGPGSVASGGSLSTTRSPVSSNNPFSDAYRVSGPGSVSAASTVTAHQHQQQQQGTQSPAGRASSMLDAHSSFPAARNLQRVNDFSIGASEATVVEHHAPTQPESVV